MSTMFEELREGLLQAIDYAKGTGSARTNTFQIDSIIEFDNQQIREIKRRDDSQNYREKIKKMIRV